ncbi:hypothetical protein ACS0TY_034342 [Phlomoides rotata]
MSVLCVWVKNQAFDRNGDQWIRDHGDLNSSTTVGEKMNTPSDEQKKLNSGQIPTPEETKLKVLKQRNGEDASEAAILKICQKHYLNMMSSNIDFVCYIQSFCMFEKFVERLVFVMLGARL